MSAAGKKWTAKQRKANRAHFAKLKAGGKSAWSPERKAKFLATMLARYPERYARKARKARKAGDGVDMDAATPRANGAGGQHFPLDLIPDKVPMRAKVAARPRAKSNGDAREFPDNAEGARLAVAMQLLRTIEKLLNVAE